MLRIRPVTLAPALALAALLLSAACATRPAPETQGAAPPATVASVPASAAIGVAKREFADPERSNWPQTGPRPLRTILWYPAGAGGTPETQEVYGRDKALLRDAPLAGGASRPLLLLSHGAGSRADHMAWLGHVLAGHGFIVAAVEHNGSPEEELHSRPTPSDHFAWERARDLSTVLDALLQDPALGPAIDRERIGAAGFSLGGTTVLWLAGARLDLAHLRRNAPPMPAERKDAIENLIRLPQSNGAARSAQQRAERSHRDPRVRSVFALAPAMGFGFTTEGLREVEVPVRIVVGDADPVTPAAPNARHFAEGIAGARYLEVPGERGHYTGATPAEVRAPELEEIADMAAAFFDETLQP